MPVSTITMYFNANVNEVFATVFANGTQDVYPGKSCMVSLLGASPFCEDVSLLLCQPRVMTIIDPSGIPDFRNGYQIHVKFNRRVPIASYVQVNIYDDNHILTTVPQGYLVSALVGENFTFSPAISQGQKDTLLEMHRLAFVKSHRTKL